MRRVRKKIKDAVRSVPKMERKAVKRLGRAREKTFSPGRFLPLLFAVSIGLWVFAPPQWMRTLTPFVGALALLCAGLYLSRVVFRIGNFFIQHEEKLGGRKAARVKKLRGAMYKMLFTLFSTMVIAGGFFYLSTRVLEHSAIDGQPGLLWALTVGGMVLALVFGEFVTALIETMDEILSSEGLAPLAPDSVERAED